MRRLVLLAMALTACDPPVVGEDEADAGEAVDAGAVDSGTADAGALDAGARIDGLTGIGLIFANDRGFTRRQSHRQQYESPHGAS